MKNEVISPGAFDRKGWMNSRGMRVSPSEAALSPLCFFTRENTTDPEMQGIPIGAATDWVFALGSFPYLF